MPRQLQWFGGAVWIAALVVLAGCGASSPVVPERLAPGTVMQLPRDYGIKCPAAMLARRGGVGGSGIWTDADGGGLTIGALRFPDEESARRAYAATVSPQAQRCYADGVAAALAQHWGVKVRRMQTRPSKRDGPTTGETTNTPLSVVVAAERRGRPRDRARGELAHALLSARPPPAGRGR
jgi:hypothetical protein